MAQTFKDRLKLLIKDERPYTWSRKVGIEKGLFQYYWQKGKIPTHINLIKIQNYSGCSLDWLLTGKSPTGSQIENIAMAVEKEPVFVELDRKREKTIKNIDNLYKLKDTKNIDLLESVLDLILRPDDQKVKKGRRPN
jgi:hypothetical protein